MMPQPSMPYTRHGGCRDDYRERFGDEPLDFSANVNPYGMSPAVRAAAIAAVDQAIYYPDPKSRRLSAAIAAHDGVCAYCVCVGNGAADLIIRLAAALAPRRALVLAPTFSEYEDALVQVGCQVQRCTLTEKDGFVPTPALLDAVVDGIDAVFVCEPNNPTGLCMGRDLLLALLAKCRQVGAVLVVDECFNGFLPNPSASSIKDQVEGEKNLVVLRAFTKLYGMAGLRLGYLLCSDAELLSKIEAHGQSWPVSCVAQAAGVAALTDGEWVDQCLRKIAASREKLACDLVDLGLEVWPGQANYLMFRSCAPDLYQRLAQRGVLVRDCSNYHGLGPGFYRVAVKDPALNDLLVKAIGDVLACAAQEKGQR